MTTDTELRTAAVAAYEARRAREEQEHQARIENAITVLRERAGETLYEALEIRTEPTDWKLDVDRYIEDGRGRAIITTRGLRFAYQERGYGQGGPATELTVQHRCERCAGWFDAQDISRGTSSYPAIERLGRYLAQLEEGPDVEHHYCPAERRCADDACLRPDPHYGHAPDVQAAEDAAPFEEPAQDEPKGPDPLTPDEELGNALRRWLGANPLTLGTAIHEELERYYGKPSRPARDA